MHRRVLCLTVLIAATAAFAACDENLSSIAGPTPNLEPTFSSIQAEIFESTDVGGGWPVPAATRAPGAFRPAA